MSFYKPGKTGKDGLCILVGESGLLFVAGKGLYLYRACYPCTILVGSQQFTARIDVFTRLASYFRFGHQIMSCVFNYVTEMCPPLRATELVPRLLGDGTVKKVFF